MLLEDDLAQEFLVQADNEDNELTNGGASTKKAKEPERVQGRSSRGAVGDFGMVSRRPRAREGNHEEGEVKGGCGEGRVAPSTTNGSLKLSFTL